MCEYVSDAMSRRGFLRRAGAAGVVAGLAGAGGASAAGRAGAEDASAAGLAGAGGASAAGLTGGASAHERGERAAVALDHARERRYRTRLALLGTAGGPSWFTAGRRGASSAVMVEDAIYLIDCGDGFGPRMLELVGTPKTALSPLHAVFLTHLHSDHTIDYVNLPVIGMLNGLTPARPVPVLGPGDRGGLAPVFPPGRPAPAVVSPDDPTPGTVAMTEYLYKAYATDLNDRLRDGASPDPRTILAPRDIALPAGMSGPVDHNPMPPVAPFPIYEDSLVRVTATLVNHAPVFPSFAFRFDTDDGSITFSGDTARSDNLIRLARDTDVLVHEVIDVAWVESLFPPPRTPIQDALFNHLTGSHTPIEEVGPIAEEAGARTLVLNHLVPADNPVKRWHKAAWGFSGRLLVGEDLMQVGVGRRPR
jgi:ribonuclease BN (tRNA processing enzyme)